MKHSTVNSEGLKLQLSLTENFLKIMILKPTKEKATVTLIIALLITLTLSGLSRSEEIEKPMPQKSIVHSKKNLLAKVLPKANFHFEIFSQDGKQVAYIASKHGKYFVVIGNKEGEKYDEVGVPMFSQDNNQVAYTAKKGKKEFAVLGEKRSEEFDSISRLMFRPHDNQITYIARKGRKNFLVVGDSKVQLKYPYPNYAVFSHDGKQLAYVASTLYKPGEPQKEFIVVGDRKGEEYTQVQRPVFSPDGKSVAYAATNLWGDLADIGKWFVMVDGIKRKGRYSTISNVTFSPDGKQVAYVARKKDVKCSVVVGNKEGEKFDVIDGPLLFNPNGTQIAYMATKGGKMFIVMGGRKGEEFDGVDPPVFSPNGKKVAYRAVRRVRGKSLQSVIIGDKKDEAFDPIFGFPIVFSPDSRQVAYQARKGGKMFIVIGDKRSEEFDRVDNPVFSSDGKSIGFGAKEGNKLLWNVMHLER